MGEGVGELNISFFFFLVHLLFLLNQFFLKIFYTKTLYTIGKKREF